jgi:hypothetical protein
VFASPHDPLWEQTLLAPYAIVRLPFRGLNAGARAAFVFLDDHRVTGRIRRLLGPRRGPFGFAINVTAGGLSGFGGGLTLFHDSFLSPANRAKLRFQYTADGGRRGTFGLVSGEGGISESSLGLGGRLMPTARYFGLGPDSDRRDKSLYEEEQIWAAVSHLRRFGHGIAVEGRAMLSAVDARKGPRDSDPPLEEAFAGRLPAGYGRRSNAFATSVALRHDTTVESGRPECGGVRRVMVGRTDEIGSERTSFWIYRGDVEQFVPLWNDQQTLALRGFFTWSEPVGSSNIPFQRLTTNDDPDILRGYQDLRFRDRGMTALTLEYRWPVWALGASKGTGVDAYLLSDFGQVFGDRRELAIDRITESYGGGLRFIGSHGFVGRLEVAHSIEETKLRLRADQVFQFARGGLYHGRNPVPQR